MRWLALILIIFLGLAVGVLDYIKAYPFEIYSRWIQGDGGNRYYQLSETKIALKSPSKIKELIAYQEDYPQLWKSFPIGNTLLSLPTRHPMYRTTPIIEVKQNNPNPLLGMTLAGPDGRELISLYTLPMSQMQDYLLDQELFKLPYVRNRIIKLNHDWIWKEVFSRQIQPKSKSIEEMIQDLYILHVRSKLLPPTTLNYGLIKDNKVIIELSSKDQDYMVEMILVQNNRNIFCYVLKTAKANVESLRLRSKFITSSTFLAQGSAMARILYTEFKELNFSRQFDQEGLLYLFSAWSQDIQKVELLKEMIFFIERGKKNIDQLKHLYTYAYKTYGKTFTTKNVFTENEDPNIALQRKIELEEFERMQANQNKEPAPVKEKDLSPKKQLESDLQKAKEQKGQDDSEMTIH
jgi:hypothetical protein